MTAVRKTRAERQAELVAQVAPARAPMAPTATERIEALVELRRTQGLIVPMPALLPVDDAKPAHEQERDHQHNCRTVTAWLQEIAQKGAGQDIDAAWQHLANKRVKGEVRNHYDQLRLLADRNFFRLASDARAEEAAARRVWLKGQEIASLTKKIEAAEKIIRDARQRIAQLSEMSGRPSW